MKITPAHSRVFIWKEAPFLRLSIPFVVGILLQYHIPLPLYPVLIFFVLTFICQRLYEKKINFKQFGHGWQAGLAINARFLLLGQLIAFVHTDVPEPVSISRSFAGPRCLVGRLETQPVEKRKTYQAVVSTSFLLSAGKCVGFHQQVLLYFHKPFTAERLSPGAIIIFQDSLQPIQNTTGDSGFDYKAYCARNHIHAQAFLRSEDFVICSLPKRHPPIFWIRTLRQKILVTLRQYIPGKEASGLMEALLVGYTGDLDKAVVSDYTNSGVVHIIAISGMHLVLIYSLLAFFLQRMSDRGFSRWLKTLLLLAALWIFSILCGGSASVLRSAVMFTFLLTGKTLSKKISSVNSLAASAFLLLTYNPWWLWDVGFELSYLAVFGILIFRQPLYELLPMKNKMLASAWSAASVSIAAQLATTPICLFYFRQFPNYFLLTNLLAVPLSSLVLLAGLLVCGISWLPSLAVPVGQLTGWLVRLLDGFIAFVAHLPYAVLHTRAMLPSTIVGAYFLLLISYQWLRTKQTRWLIASLSFLLILQLLKFL